MKNEIFCVFVVFVAYAYGQTYVGRTRGVKPVLPKTVLPKPILPKPVHPKPLFSRFQGGGRDADLPPHIRKLLGSTFDGSIIIGGMGNFPRHGGAGGGAEFANGLRSGWGAFPEAQVHPAVSGWVDPLDGRPFPVDYAGEDLGHRIIKNQQHQVAKATHVAAKSGMPVVGSPVIGSPVLGSPAQAQHNIMKESDHIVRKTVGGAGVIGGIGAGINPIPLDYAATKPGAVIDPVGHSIRKSSGLGGLGPVVDPIGHSIDKSMGVGQVVDPVGHSIRKSSGVVGGGFGPAVDPIGHSIDKSMGVGPVVDPVGHSIRKSSGMVAGGFGPAVDPIGHSIDKSMGVGPVVDPVGHSIRKSSGVVGGGFGPAVDPIGHSIDKSMGVGQVVDPVGHSIRKSSGVVGGGFGPAVDPIGHSIDKSMGVGPVVDPLGFGGVSPVGMAGGSFGPVVDPVGHNIDKSLGIAPVGLGAAGVGLVGGGLINDPIHNVAKATGGVQVLPPTGHEIRKSVGFEIAAGRPVVDPIGHSMVKSSVGQGMSPFGTVSNPVHNVRKVGATGLTSIGHDPLAANIGLGMAEQAAHQSSKFVDIGSRGGVSMGDPLANAAAQGLAREAIHVAGKTLDLASSGGVGVGLPNVPVKPKAQMGYGRRRPKGQAVRAW